MTGTVLHPHATALPYRTLLCACLAFVLGAAAVSAADQPIIVVKPEEVGFASERKLDRMLTSAGRRAQPAPAEHPPLIAR